MRTPFQRSRQSAVCAFVALLAASPLGCSLAQERDFRGAVVEQGLPAETVDADCSLLAPTSTVPQVKVDGELPRFAPASPAEPVEAILVSEEDAWLLALAAPLAAKLRSGPALPIVMAISEPPTQEAVELLKRIAPRRAIVLTAGERPFLAQGLDGLPADLLDLGAVPLTAGRYLARRFWEQTDEVVLAFSDDPGGFLLGATLAAHGSVPFIPVHFRRKGRTLVDVLESIGIRKATVVLCADRRPQWLDWLRQPSTVLDARAVTDRVVQKLGVNNIHNIILARLPDRRTEEVGSVWLMPYLSLARGAVPALSRSAAGPEAERRVMGLVAARRLRPRSITILADYHGIGLIPFDCPTLLGDYALDMEPCATPVEGRALAWAVGRIPCAALRDASALIARTLARDRLLAQTPPRVLMVANPPSTFGVLPLCETVSRLTAQEFKNFGVPVDEFYGITSNDPAILAAAAKASLVLYEGHLFDQCIFDAPSSYRDVELPPDEPGQVQDVPRIVVNGIEVIIGYADGRPVAQSVGTTDDATDLVTVITVPPDPTNAEHSTEYGPSPSLDGLPLVILQSCNSLEEEMARHIFERGGAAVIGSTTSIHSASGSSFMKAFCDGVLYRSSTIGEALRDARNYFFCLNALKNRRGHKQQAKGYRVALSFRLWGDPEMRLLPRVPRKPKREPVSPAFEPPNGLKIVMPARRLPECRTDRYYARLFPHTQAAGIVKRIKGQPARKLAPLHFHRLPTPPNFVERAFRNLSRAGEETPRAVFMTDSLNRFVYTLYFPKKAAPGESVSLQFN